MSQPARVTNDVPLAAARPATQLGRVSFIGVGVGDPQLLTLAAARLLADAQEVLLDRDEFRALLAHPALSLRPDVQIAVLEPGDPVARCVEREVSDAQDGLDVVRLVEGDTLFNPRCRAEAIGCSRHGVPVEIAPGVSPLTAMPTFAGFAPATHDGSHFLAVEPSGLGRTTVPGAGEVFVWCRTDQVEDVVAAARLAGRDAHEPALVTFKAATGAQHSVLTELGRLQTIVRREGAADAGPEPLAVVLGAADADELDWFESKPMFGWQVLVPKTKETMGELERWLMRHGAATATVPTIAVEPPRNPQPMDRAITGLVDGRYEWIVFTSSSAVRAVIERLENYGLDARAFSGLRVAAAGPMTVQALQEWGIRPDLVPEDPTGHGLAAEFPAFDDLLDPINRVLIPRADIAIEELSTGLAELGWQVEDVTAYRTVRAAPPPAETREAIKTGRFDAVVFTSSSAVRNLLGIAGKPPTQTIVAAIGPATADACREYGLRVDVVAERPTHHALVDALVAFAAERREAMLAAGETVVPPSHRRRRRNH